MASALIIGIAIGIAIAFGIYPFDSDTDSDDPVFARPDPMIRT